MIFHELSKRTVLLCSALLVQVLDSTAAAQTNPPNPVYKADMLVNVQITIGGHFANGQAAIDLKDLNAVPIDNIGFGTAAKFTGSLGKSNCNGDFYDYTRVEIDHAWIGVVNIDGVNYPVTHANNKAYWDWYYQGYNVPAACDYTQNCHGYAFGVGDWVDNARMILAVGGAFPVGGVPANSCYSVVPTKDARVASDWPRHSIKVEGTECNVPPPPNGPIPVDEDGNPPQETSARQVL